MTGTRGNGKYRGIYLTAGEDDVLERIAEANGTSRNFVLRCALRQLAGLPSTSLTVPDDDEAGEVVVST